MHGVNVRNTRTRPAASGLFLLFLYIIAVNAFDAWATLELVRDGAREFNPLMRYALSKGSLCFISVKMALTFTFVLALIWFARKSWTGYWIIFGLITTLFVYQLFALMFVLHHH